MTSPVICTEHDTHLLISMDDGKANALGFDMFDGLAAALDAAEAAGKVVVLVGRPGRFSAGFDLSVMAKMDASTAALL
ncbi:MAG: enoyl-CoA hydratase-related protein, partial [Halieaceae bacterium]|nr:enoyl-CoA hydratase-related protein [Halieaceae bacterium]